MISEHIEDLIVATKAKPNGLWRNKTLSHLQNALATSKMDEAEKYLNPPGKDRRHDLNDLRRDVCTCPDGGRSYNCVMHGTGLISS